MLVYSIIVTPFRIAFFDNDPLGWILADGSVDFVFAVDIFINFFTAYFDYEDNFIKDRKKIACNYVKGWFWIDLISIFPVTLIMQSSRDYSSLARLSRLPRLYRLMKMSK